MSKTIKHNIGVSSGNTDNGDDFSSPVQNIPPGFQNQFSESLSAGYRTEPSRSDLSQGLPTSDVLISKQPAQPGLQTSFSVSEKNINPEFIQEQKKETFQYFQPSLQPLDPSQGLVGDVNAQSLGFTVVEPQNQTFPFQSHSQYLQFLYSQNQGQYKGTQLPSPSFYQNPVFQKANFSQKNINQESFSNPIGSQSFQPIFQSPDLQSVPFLNQEFYKNQKDQKKQFFEQESSQNFLLSQQIPQNAQNQQKTDLEGLLTRLSDQFQQSISLQQLQNRKETEELQKKIAEQQMQMQKQQEQFQTQFQNQFLALQEQVVQQRQQTNFSKMSFQNLPLGKQHFSERNFQRLENQEPKGQTFDSQFQKYDSETSQVEKPQFSEQPEPSFRFPAQFQRGYSQEQQNRMQGQQPQKHTSNMEWEYLNQVPPVQYQELQEEPVSSYVYQEPTPAQDYYRASPTQVVQVSDIKNYKPGEDMRLYITKFDNSYLGTVENDAKKIFRLINKLQDVDTVYQFALDHKHYNSYTYFKRALLEKYAKDEDALCQELEGMIKEPQESYSDFLDRMYSKLSIPHIAIDMSFYVGEMYRKLPKDLQRMMKKSTVKTFPKLREQVKRHEADPYYQQMSYMTQQMKRFNKESTSQSSNYQSQNRFQPNRQSVPSSPIRENVQNRQNIPGRSTNTGRTNTNQPGRVNYNQGRGNPNPGRGGRNTQHQTYTAQYQEEDTQGSFGEVEQDPVQQNDYQEEEYKSYYGNITALETIAEEEDSNSERETYETYPVETRHQKRTKADQEPPMNPKIADSNVEDQSMRLADAGHVQRGFQFLDYKKPTVGEIEKQLVEAKMRGSCRCLVDRGLFRDENNAFQLTKFKDSFEVSFSITELEQMLEQSKAGHIPIYYQQIQESRQMFREICEDVQEQNESQKVAVKVSKAGKLKMIDISVDDQILTATLDTGAVKTLISNSAVEHLSLQKYLQFYKKKPLVKGVAGTTYIQSFLKEVPLFFKDDCLKVDIPIIPTQEFQMLLASDVLDYGLQECIIDIHNQELSFRSFKTKQKVSLPLYIFEKSNVLNTFHVNSIDSNLEATWPYVLQFPVKFDLCLIDLPFGYPPTMYKHDKIKFQTYTVKQLEPFGQVLNASMKEDAVLLFWVSCKKVNEMLYLLNLWGFSYFNILLVWAKIYKQGNPQMGLGYWSRNNVELLIMSKRGKINQFKTDTKNISQLFYTLFDKQDSSEHSSKPSKVYEILRQIFKISQMNCVEFFARKKNSEIQQKHFCLYGDEIDGYIYIPERYNIQAQPSKPLQTYECQFSCEEQDFQIFYQKQDIPEQFKEDEQVLRLFQKHYDIFDCKGQVGLAKNYQLKLKVKPNSSCPKTRQPFYNKEQLEVLKLTIQDWQDKDLIKDGHTDFIFYSVIVKKRGVSQDQPLNKKYRTCFNFQPLNEVLQDEVFIQNDSEQIISEGSESMYISVVDLVMAHQQIGVPEDQQYLLGLWTPEGVKISKRGQFGILPIAKAFSKALKLTIQHLKPFVWAYADDITVFAKSKEHMICLLDELFQALKDNGFILSHKKGNFFKTEMNILGQIVGNNQVRVDPQRIITLQNLSVPKTKTELQRFIGLLSYLRKFIPNLATLLKPLYQATTGQAFVLSQLQIQIFEQLKYIVTSNSVLMLPDLKKEFYIALSYSNMGYGACLLQKYDEKFKPVGYCSKTMEPQDMFKPQYYLKLKALEQAIKEWRKWIVFQKVVVITDNKILGQALKFTGENQTLNNLQAKIFDIDLQVEIKPNTFKPLKYSQLLCTQTQTEQQEALDELLTEYERLNLQQQVSPKQNKEFEFDYQYNKYNYTALFDGACSRKLKYRTIGVYAWVILSNEGQEVLNETGEVCSNTHQITNNYCENQALFKLLDYVHTSDLSFEKLQIIGDSELTIRQLKGQYRINNNAIRSIQRQTKSLFRVFKNKITLKSVPRRFNSLADSYAQRKMKELLLLYSQQQYEMQTFTVVDVDPIDEIICQVCGKKSESQIMYICDACGYGQHRFCLGENVTPNKEYFFCKRCDVQIFCTQNTNDLDLTQDIEFLEFLQEQNNPKYEPSGSRKYGHLAKSYVYQGGSLFFKTPQGLKRVPSKAERVSIMAQIHSNLGHPSIATTTKAIMQDFYWPNVVSETLQFVKTCALCQARKSKYLPMSNVFPTTKGLSIWQYVSIDLIEIRKKEEGPERYIMSVICNFSKAPELIPLKNKTAETTSQAFQDQVLYRYGCPLVVRTDSGKEFEGEFSQLMFKCHILHVKSSPRYPQSNGLVECLNGTIKTKLQTLYNDDTYSDKWINLVQLIAFSVRVSISRSTMFSPYQLMYGRDCRLPGTAPVFPYDTFQNPTLDYLTVYVNHLLKFFKGAESKVRLQLQKMDEEIKHSMQAKSLKVLTDLSFSQPIFVKSSDPTKLNLGVEGICYFVKYINPVRRDTIVYYNPNSAQFLKANISNVKVCNLPS